MKSQINLFEILRERILIRAGIIELPKAKYNFTSLQKTEWFPEFENLMRNRMIMGALRYGLMEEKRNKKHNWDLVGSIERKIKKYKETGNTELLVDIANYCGVAFEFDNHPNKHFNATDDQDHCKTI